MNAGLIESALNAQGRKLIVVDDTELDDDLVCDMTEVLTCSAPASMGGAQPSARRTRR